MFGCQTKDMEFKVKRALLRDLNDREGLLVDRAFFASSFMRVAKH